MRDFADTMQTDDVGVFGSTLSNEYALVAEHFGLNRKEICELAWSAIDITFADEAEKERLRETLWVELSW
jgi:adenosine deaminase